MSSNAKRSESAAVNPWSTHGLTSLVMFVAFLNLLEHPRHHLSPDSHLRRRAMAQKSDIDSGAIEPPQGKNIEFPAD